MSQLRCRPGDLAYVAGPGVTTPGLEGRFVVVERLLEPGDRLENGAPIAPTAEPSWLIRSAVSGQKLPNSRANGMLESLYKRACADHILRPIRPSDGEDESLQWAGKPKDIAITRPEAFDYQAYARERAGEGV